MLSDAGGLSEQLDYITSEVNESLESVRDALCDLFAALKELVEAPVDTSAASCGACEQSGEGPVGTDTEAEKGSTLTVTGCRCAFWNVLEDVLDYARITIRMHASDQCARADVECMRSLLKVYH
jgi:hypothetical protein